MSVGGHRAQRASLAVFDFDGTLTRRDTLFPFLRHVAGPARFAAGIAVSTPVLAGFALGVVRNDVAKEAVLARFLGGRSIAELSALGDAFARSGLPGLLRPDALARLAWHRRRGDGCVLVSASLDVYVEPWARRAGFDHIISSRLQRDRHDRVTGRLDGGNCYGPEKLRRLEQHVGPLDRFVVYAYGDSRGDRELLAAADFPYFKTMPTEP